MAWLLKIVLIDTWNSITGSAKFIDLQLVLWIMYFYWRLQELIKLFFYFCFIFCIYIQKVVYSSNILLPFFFFFLFQLIPKSVSAWSCSKFPPICAIHNDIFNSCTGCNTLRNISHYWELSLRMKDVVSAFPNMTFQKASREKTALLSFASNLCLKDDWKLCQVHWKGFVWLALPRVRLCLSRRWSVAAEVVRAGETESPAHWTLYNILNSQEIQAINPQYLNVQIICLKTSFSIPYPRPEPWYKQPRCTNLRTGINQ